MANSIPTVQTSAPSSTRNSREVVILSKKVDVLTTMVQDLQAKQASQAAAATTTASLPLDARIGNNELMVVSYNIQYSHSIIS